MRLVLCPGLGSRVPRGLVDIVSSLSVRVSRGEKSVWSSSLSRGHCDLSLVGPEQNRKQREVTELVAGAWPRSRGGLLCRCGVLGVGAGGLLCARLIGG